MQARDGYLRQGCSLQVQPRWVMHVINIQALHTSRYATPPFSILGVYPKRHIFAERMPTNVWKPVSALSIGSVGVSFLFHVDIETDSATYGVSSSSQTIR